MSSKKTSSSERPDRRELGDDDLVGGDHAPDLLAAAIAHEDLVGVAADVRALGDQQLASRRTSGPGDPHPPPPLRAIISVSGAWATERPRLITTTSSAVWETSASTWLETSTARPSRGQRPQEVAQPADALRVEAVGGLVEHEHPGVAEQGGRQAEPLAHAERVAAGAAVGRVVERDELEQLVRPARPAMPAALASARRWLRPERPGWSMPPSSTAPTVCTGSSSWP